MNAPDSQPASRGERMLPAARSHGALSAWNRRLLWITLGVVTLGALVWGLLTPGASPGDHPNAQSTPLPPAPAAGHLEPNVTLVDLSNHPVALASLRGKVLVLNFWYAACEPCRFEMPLLERVYHTDQARGVQVVGINIADDAHMASAFVSQLGIDYPVLLDPDQHAVEAFKITYTPTTFFIDRQGVVRGKYVGAFTDTSTLNSYLTPLL
jgi:cytochrome c biogenesis protein CcmG, thiol:disulfide interchange protein DsbE